MLEIRNLTAGYDGKPVLRGIDLEIPAGSVTVIAGPNGCGKSTFLKVLAGILPPQGSVCLDGIPLMDMEPQARAQHIAMLPQNRHTPEITAARLVLHGRFPYLSYPRRYRKMDLQIADKAMETMGISDLADRDMRTLSGGQRQKVYIAMALAQDTPVVLLDEPTTFLDISQQLQMMGHARFLAQQGKTVVLVLHDLALALKSADRLVIMKEGCVVAQGTPEAVFEAGTLAETFGVRVERIQTADGWQYYYREEI